MYNIIKYNLTYDFIYAKLLGEVSVGSKKIIGF